VCHYQGTQAIVGLCNSPINVNPEGGEGGNFNIFQKYCQYPHPRDNGIYLKLINISISCPRNNAGLKIQLLTWDSGNYFCCESVIGSSGMINQQKLF
jgi:hypothetical protein